MQREETLIKHLEKTLDSKKKYEKNREKCCNIVKEPKSTVVELKILFSWFEIEFSIYRVKKLKFENRVRKFLSSSGQVFLYISLPSRYLKVVTDLFLKNFDQYMILT